MRLKGERALITGGASGIGRAALHRFLREGAECVSLDLNPHEIEGAFSVVADLASGESTHQAACEIRKRMGDPTIVVHAAATTAFATTLETTDADVQKILSVNVGGAFHLAQEFAPAMQIAGKGSIVVLSSITGLVGAPGMAAYAASKGALITWTRTLALELAPSPVRLNCICPASSDTPLLRASFERLPDPEAARAANIKRHPLGRFGTPDDVANLILFLASEEASWITGGTYVIDGGASIARRWQE